MSTYWTTTELNVPQGNAFMAFKQCLEQQPTEQQSECRRKYFTAYKAAVADGVKQQQSSILALSKGSQQKR